MKLISMLGFVEVVDPVQQIRLYQQQAPSDVPLTEGDIMEEIKSYRKGKG
jgi:hypothetical protein